jgi:hypothetical protein
VSDTLPESLRAELVEALAQLLVEDVEHFPTLPAERDAGAERPS